MTGYVLTWNPARSGVDDVRWSRWVSRMRTHRAGRDGLAHGQHPPRRDPRRERVAAATGHPWPRARRSGQGHRGRRPPGRALGRHRPAGVPRPRGLARGPAGGRRHRPGRTRAGHPLVRLASRVRVRETASTTTTSPRSTASGAGAGIPPETTRFRETPAPTGTPKFAKSGSSSGFEDDLADLAAGLHEPQRVARRRRGGRCGR